MLVKQNKDGDHLSSFKYCLNTSTIRSENATVLDAIDTAANAGYTGIEPWVGELDDFLSDGGELKTVKEKADDRGVEIVNLIAFPEWAVPEEDRRQVGLDEQGEDVHRTAIPFFCLVREFKRGAHAGVDTVIGRCDL